MDSCLGRDLFQACLPTPEYCVRLFGDNSVKARRNKRPSDAVCAYYDIAISWIKAHTGSSSPEALGNAAADQLAARGRSGSSSAVARLPSRIRRSRRPRAFPSSNPLRRSGRQPRVRFWTPFCRRGHATYCLLTVLQSCN